MIYKFQLLVIDARILWLDIRILVERIQIQALNLFIRLIDKILAKFPEE